MVARWRALLVFARIKATTLVAEICSTLALDVVAEFRFLNEQERTVFIWALLHLAI